MKAFGEYLTQAWAYALASNDASLLTAASVGKKPCEGCAALERELAKREKAGWFVYPFEAPISTVGVARAADKDATVTVHFSVPETRSYFDTGSYRNTSEAHDDATFTAVVRPVRTPDGKRFGLVKFTVA